jgi:bifunctional non-homologous end joining protein LigD
MPSRTSENVELNGHTFGISSRDKLYWPDEGLTKGDTLDYYRRIAGFMLPYLHDRPATLRAFPQGIRGPGFWRREKPARAPKWLPSVAYEPESREERIAVPIIDNEAALIWYVNQSAIEIHQWMSRSGDLDHPDWAVFDLDPGQGVAFDRVLQAVLRVRENLSKVGLECFAKTSGASGMHLFVPIEPEHPFDDVRTWVHGVAARLEERHPGLIAVASGGTHRGDVVTVDHAQNSIARNTAGPYTLRARPGATVSTPLTWAEVEVGKVRPEQFTLRTVPERLEREGDPWRGSASVRQRLALS